MTSKLQRMAEYFESRNQDRAAETWAEFGERGKAAVLYAVAGDRHRGDADHLRARTSYLRAAEQYTLVGQHDQAQGMRQNVRDCEAHIRELERTGVMQDQASPMWEQAAATRDAGYAQASATREGLAALAQALREGFMTTAQALINGFTTLAQAQREAAMASAEIVCRGLERLAASQTEGFAQLASATREGDLLQAISTYAAIKGIGRRNIEAAEALKHAITGGLQSLSPAQRGSAAQQTLKLFDVLTKMLPAEAPSAPGPVPESLARRIVHEEVGHMRRREPGSHAEASGGSVRLENSHCLLGSGPEDVVLNIVRSDGSIYQQCTLARAALTRRWHGIDAFSAKYLEQGGCPLPRSLGLIQRNLWFRTCYLADGREHRQPT